MKYVFTISLRTLAEAEEPTVPLTPNLTVNVIAGASDGDSPAENAIADGKQYGLGLEGVENVVLCGCRSVCKVDVHE